MFCDRCGKEIDSGSKFCAACGKPVGMAVVPSTEGRVARNVRILGILWLIYGALRGMAAFWILFVSRFVAPAILSRIPVEPLGFPLARIISSALFFQAGLATFIAIAGLVTAWGLMQHEAWARTLAIITAVVALLSLPLGTALGVYTLIVMLPRQSEEEYQRLSRAA